MSYWFRTVIIAGIAALVWAAGSSSSLFAQLRTEGIVRTAGTTANLFETLDPVRPLDAVRLTLPGAWTLEEVRLLRYGTTPVPVQVRSQDQEGTHLLTTAHPVRGPHELVVRVRLPERSGAFEWEIQSLVRDPPASDSMVEPRYRSVEHRTRAVTLDDSSPPEGANQALALSGESAPALLAAERTPPLGRSASFTLEFWMRTNGLDEVILSTWNGEESVAYPAEFVVDRGGRLRFYSGEPGRHRALRSSRPVADGQWHHVAAVYEASRSKLRLLVGGHVADSLSGHIPSSPGAVPVAIGGRAGHDASPDADSLLFSGHLDEVRIWEQARSPASIRRMKSRPLQTEAESKRDRPVVGLGFDAGDRALVQRAEGVRSEPVDLSFQSSLQDLEAHSRDRTVTLRWSTRATEIEAFIVERSQDGRSFTDVATVTPSDVRYQSASEGATFSYSEEDVPGQIVYYRIRQRRTDGSERTSGTIKMGLGATTETTAPVELVGNFPNPFTETTTIAYEVREAKPVSITVWDLAGHRIAQLTDGTREPGYHEISFDATDLPSGTYFVRLETPSETQSHRMVVLK